MAKKRLAPQLGQPGRRKPDGIRLLIAVGPQGQGTAREVIRAEARQRDWSVLDISLTGNVVPPGYQPQVAIVSYPADDPLCKKLLDQGVHVVRQGIGCHVLDHLLPAVVADRVAEGRMAAEHYAERGFRSVGVAHYGHMFEFDQSFRKHAAKLGCSFYDYDLSPTRSQRELSPEERYEQESKRFCQWAVQLPTPTGLLQRSDTMSARFCHFCIQAGIDIPDQIALLGRADQETVCEFAPVRLSSIHLATETRYLTCFRLLDKMLAGRQVKESPIMIAPKGVVTRESTDLRASQNADVAKALRYMWDHYDDMELSVDTIAEVVGFSRRKLERLFRSELGQTVNDALLARRLERCCVFLLTSELNASDICYRVGLRSRAYLYRAFKRTYGMTLKEYREKPAH